MSNPLEKRIKRRVIGRDHDFFAVTAPGFETLCLGEITSLGLDGSAVPGGVEFTGRLHACYLANLWLRTAGRVLMRVHAFRATSFSALEGESIRFPWELVVSPGPLPRLHVTTHHCRLYHTEGIAERVLSGILERLGHTAAAAGLPDSSVPGSQIFIRGTDDHFVVSIDSSGENLYVRGVKAHQGEAPLRETIAAALLMRAGFSGAETLMDPMCGTGTFSLEAALMAKRIPPGWFRSFAFTRWPAFRKPRWDYLRRRAAEGFQTLGAPAIFASDIDSEACRTLEECIRAHGLADAVAVSDGDFFRLDPRSLTDQPGWVVLNPPYGRRIGKPAESRNLIRAVLDRLYTRYSGWKFILVIPEGRGIPTVPGPVMDYRLIHGGLTVRAIMGEIRP